MERELLISGIGGQGIQLAAQVVARAAVAEGREVQVFGSYGGMMRGGNTEATVVVGEVEVESPPTVSDAWSGIAVHPDHARWVVDRLRGGGLLLVNSSVFEQGLDVPPSLVLEVPASAVATEVGNVVTASMVLLGAHAAATGLVGLGSLIEAVGSCLPPYRARLTELNEEALRRGFALVPGVVAAAWADRSAA